MSTPAPVVLRRTWPQRIVILACLVVIAAALASAWFLDDVWRAVRSVGRVEISGSVLVTDTPAGAPVNFLLVGEDSAARLDPDDPAAFARVEDPGGNFNADSITILRVDPSSGQAWVLSVPRDLLVENPETGREVKINSTLLVGGPDLLIETVKANFDIEINHYVTLDFLGFREVVDRLGGIPVWFDRPARDRNLQGDNSTGLDIPTAGCHVLDGVASLQYVRSRYYQEFIDGDWEYVGNGDFGRIERQQDFLVLALERAIDKGARNPTTLASLIEAGAESIVLDDELTVSELVDLGESFSDFTPENLQRFGLTVSTIEEGGRYVGERLVSTGEPGAANEAVFAVFRGQADLLAPSEVSFALYAADPEVLEVDGNLLGPTIGFDLTGRFTTPPGVDESVIVYPPGQLAAAETVARYLLPTPPLVEDPAADGITLVLGSDHDQVLFLFPADVVEMRAAVEAHGDVDVPDLSGAVPVGSDGETAVASSTTAAPTTTTTDDIPAVAPPGADDADGATGEQPDDGDSRIIGQAPEGESCG